ncbi:MAG TPA: SHOCT domain-containing protein [Thermoplasmatales archaeon]|nr:SHOCT domain-containing protein [Thermoplasmatales archaeon]
MMGWRFIPFFNYWTMFVWVVQLVVGVLVYRDAKKRGDGLLWFVVVVLPWVGFLFLLVYLILRGEEKELEDVFEDAVRVVDERYARGEISREEYLQMKKDIKRKE